MSGQDSPGYVMSNSQLHELWHYDMWLGNVIMDLPLRKCSAAPNVDIADFQPMEDNEYCKLKNEIRGMWITASQNFKCKQGEFGWGLFFCKDFVGRCFTGNKPAILGWLARAPPAGKCPTAHRYMRSMWVHEERTIYLGGPLNLVNFDEEDRITCQLFDSKPLQNKVGVVKVPKRKIVDDQEVLWSYDLSPARKCDTFYPVSKWQQSMCCSQEDCSQIFSMPNATSKEQSSKKRKVVSHRPHKTAAFVSSYKFCTYCGLNLAASLDVGVKENMKRHWALKHTVDLCMEMNVFESHEEEPVFKKHFMIHLNKVDHVYYSLHNHNYKVVPACNFFDITGTAPLPPTASAEEKHNAFTKFLVIGKAAFKQYQVLYLKGISVPQQYDDLLQTNSATGYDKINWGDGKPPNNNFSLTTFNLTEEENVELTMDIKKEIMNVVVAWM